LAGIWVDRTGEVKVALVYRVSYIHIESHSSLITAVIKQLVFNDIKRKVFKGLLYLFDWDPKGAMCSAATVVVYNA